MIKLSINFRRKSFKDKGSFRISATRDWRRFLIIFFILIMLVLAFSLYLFSKISEDDIFQVEVNSSSRVETIDRERLRQTLDYFDQKEKNLEQILKTKLDIIDPS